MSRRGTGRTGNRTPGAWTLVRDILTFVGGWVVIFFEVQREEVRDSVLAFAGTAIGVPGLAVAFGAIAEAYVARRTGTGESPSQPAVEAE